MKTVFSILIFLISFEAIACKLIAETVSLSGPLTMLLEELDLIHDKNLKAISIFHPIKSSNKKSYSGDILAGGIFLANKTTAKFKNKVVVFDKSAELSKILKNKSIKKTFELDTRGLNASESTLASINILKNITVGCEQKITSLISKIQKILREVNLSEKLRKSVFFLGHIQQKLPEMVIANDGFVKELKLKMTFKTYPSELTYVVWSRKEMNKLKGFLFLGVSESKHDNLIINHFENNKYNLSMRGVLTPGIRQIYFLEGLSKIKL